MIDELLKKWEKDAAAADAKLLEMKCRATKLTTEKEKVLFAVEMANVLTDCGYAHGYADGAKFVKTLLEEKI